MEWIVLGHVFFAAMLFGGQIYVEAISAAAKRSGDRRALATTFAQMGDTNGRVLGVSSILTLVFGVWLVLADSSAWKFSDLFITIGFIAIIVGFGVSVSYMGPRELKVKGLVGDDMFDSPELKTTVSQISMANHVVTLMVVIALVVMVIKPGV